MSLRDGWRLVSLNATNKRGEEGEGGEGSRTLKYDDGILNIIHQ